MGLVIGASLCVAAFAVIFRFFGRYHVPLMPAIAVNYAFAFLIGLLFAPPWRAADPKLLLLPAGLIGTLFAVVFLLIGVSAQRAGSARTTIAGRMSLVLTVAAMVIIFKEPIGAAAWVGIGCALVGLVLVTGTDGEHSSDRSWALPFIIFLGSGAADIGVSVAQRVRTTSLDEAMFTTLCFGGATAACLPMLLVKGGWCGIGSARTWAGGGALGIVNYASLLLLVQALGAGSIPASMLFPTMNILAILFASGAGLLLFGERFTRRQWTGIALCIVALSLIMLPFG